jgi:acetaldehyde dehydrogenase (acetylating)
MQLDKDLQSIQEVRDLCKRAKEAQLEFKHYTQSQVDKIVKAMADAAYDAREKLAKMAVEETGFGNVQDKITKNIFGSKFVYESIKDLKTVGVVNVYENGKIVEIAEPMGVVAALIPSTNPTSTMIYKALISVKARNSIVASPHPAAAKCTLEAAKILEEAAVKEGAPRGLINCLSIPTIEGTNELMKHRNVAIILATGSSAMVKAAYSAGKPAYGVGPGNVPAFIERTANIKKAVADIFTGKTFDNGVLCSSEQAIVCDRPIREKVIEECKRNGGYFINAEEKRMLEAVLVKDGRINPEIVGRSAPVIAQKAGFNVPPNTRVLICELNSVGKHEPLSMEKLSPILAFYTEEGWLNACHRCIDILEFGGLGHTLVIHSNDKDIIMKFALEKPTFRILVNTVAALGAVGYTTALYPSMTLGPGTWGGSIISENVTAKHLLNYKKLAFETNPMNPDSGASLNSFAGASFVQHSHSDRPSTGWIQEIEERMRIRAGNPPLKETYTYEKGKYPTGPKTGTLGSGISEEEVERIIREFKKS